MNERRFFVKVHGAGKRAVRDLRGFDLDLFVPTFKVDQEGRMQIEGLLSLEQVALLVDHGFSVTIEEGESKRSRAQETIDFGEWLKGMEEDLGPIKGG